MSDETLKDRLYKWVDEGMRRLRTRQQQDLEQLGRNQDTADMDASVLEQREEVRVGHARLRHAKMDERNALTAIELEIDNFISRTGIDQNHPAFFSVFGRYLNKKFSRLRRPDEPQSTLFSGYPDFDEKAHEEWLGDW